MSNFRIGQKVVCVHDANGPIGSNFGSGHYCGLRNGAPYVISSAWETKGLRFVEVHGIRGGWLAKRFSPIDERKTSISIFTEMLNTEQTPVKAGA